MTDERRNYIPRNAVMKEKRFGETHVRTYTPVPTDVSAFWAVATIQSGEKLP